MCDAINPGSGPAAKAFTLPISRRPGAGGGYCTTRRECALPPQGSRGTEMNCSSEEPGGSAAGLPPGCVMFRLRASGAHRSSLWRRLRPRENAVTLLRGARVAALVLAAALALGVAENAAAQTTLVSNFDATSGITNVSLDQEGAQAFTTGATGATVSSVEIISADAQGDDFDLSLCTTDASFATRPTSTCTPLTAPSSFAAGTLVFTAPANTTLDPTTTYAVLITPESAGVTVPSVGSNDEDTGGAMGWTIADSHQFRNFANAWRTSSSGGGRSLKIAIKGTLTASANAAPTVANPIDDQTATVGTVLNFTFPTNTFADTDAGATLTYTATQSDDSTLPAWLSFAAATRTFSGTPMAADVETVSVKVTASDGTDSVSDTFDIVVSAAANTPPTSADERVEADEDSDYTFLSDDFAFTDTDTGDSLVSVKIVTLPASGTLTLSDTAIGSGDLPKTVLAAEIDDLKYSPPANLYGTDVASFTFKVNDGTVDSDNAYTITIDVKGENDSATGAPTITGTAQVGETLTAVTTGIMDADGLTSVTYTYQWIRANGTEADIASANSSTYALVAADLGKTIKVKVSFEDDDSTAETLTSAATATVVAAPTAPMVSTVVVTSTPASGDTYGTGEMILFTVTFDQSVTVTGTPEFEFCLGTTATMSCDSGATPPARRRAALLSGSGTTALVFGYTVVVGDVDDNGIWTGDQSRTIKLEGGTIQGTVGGLDAVLTHAEEGEHTGHKVNGAAANTAPTAANNTVTTAEDRAYTFTAADFSFMDADAGAALASVKIVTVPVLGTLALDGTAVLAAAVVTKAQIDGDMLIFTPARDAHGVAYTTFTFKVNDGTVDSASAYTMTIDVTDAPAPVCTAPSFGDRREIWSSTVTVGVFDAFGVTAYGYEEAGSIGSLSPAGTFSIGSENFTMIGIAVRISGVTVFTFEDKLLITTLTPTQQAALRLHVCDEDYDFLSEGRTNNSFSWDTTLDWSPPVVTRTVYLSLPANNVATGEPAISGTARAGQVLTAAASPIMDTDGLTGVDFTYQWLRVDPDGTSNEEDISGEIAATYTLTDDDVGKKVKVKVSFTDNLSGEEERTSAAYPSSGTVTAAASTNTPPTAANNTVTAVAGTAYAFEADDFGFADTDTGDTLASVKIVTLPAVGTLALAGTAVTLNEVVTKAQIDDGDLTFTPVDGASGTGYATFTFKVNDGTVDSASAYTMTIDARDLSCAVPDFAGDNRRELWTGIVTAGDVRSVGYGFHSEESQTGLNDTTFAIGRNSYTVDAAFVLSVSFVGRLSFSLAGDVQDDNLTAGEVAALRLHICDTVFYDFSAATLSGNNNTYSWAGSLDWSPPVATRTLYLSLPANRDAMGEPAITGTAQVGQDLTADVAGITDADGLTGDLSTLIDNIDGLGGVEYSYQWIWVDADGSSNEEDISGEIAATYTLTDADVGKKVKVKVSFTDDLNGEEERTSAAFPSSGTVTTAGGTNNAPTSTEQLVDADEDTDYTFSADDFGFADTDAGDSLVSVKIVTLPASGTGTLTLSGTAIGSGDLPQTVLADDLDELKYSPPANLYGTDVASFTFKVNDGTVDSDNAYTMTIDVKGEDDSATGAPGITGTAQVGQTLTATVGTIADLDGLPDPFISHSLTTIQWIQVDGATEIDISGATNETYTLATADAGRKIKVKVSFEDEGGTAEGPLTSDAYPASGTVTAAGTNNAPVFSSSNMSRSIAENTAAGVNVGAAVTATDADAGDTLSYTLGGTDVVSFDFVETTGQIRTKTNVSYDFEAKSSYAVTVTASDGTATAVANVTISISDVDEPPSAPATPAVSAVSGSSTSLSVSWAAPANAGKPAIDNYDVQYRLGSSGAWTDGPQDVTGTTTTTTITSLATDTAYQARVRATNAEGDSGWSSPPGSGRTSAPTTSVPGAPRDLRTTPGDGRVTLAWTPPGSDGGAAIEKYRYRVSANAGSIWDPDWTDVPDGADAGDSAADETTFTVSGLNNGTEYVFQLRAVNSVGEGPAASDAAIPVRAPLPPGSGFLVGNFGQRADGSAQLFVTQDIVGVFTTGARGADLHNIELRLFTRRPNIAVLPIPSVTLYRASVTDSRATRGARVAALTAVAGSPQPANTAQTVAFAAPSGTRLDAGATYLVVLEHTSYVRVESTTFPAEDAGGAPGWAIDGIGAGNSSPYSYETTASLLMRVNGTATGATVATAPAAPASLGARAGDAEVTLRWTPPRSDGGAGIEKYQVRYSAGSRVDPDTAWSDVPDGSDSGTSRADERSVSVTELDNGRQYAFELRAVNGVRAGAAATATATPAAARRTGFLVSNFGQPVDGSSQISVTQDIVGAFTAGALGATLDSIELRLYSRTPDIAQRPSATLYRGSVTATRATPGTRVATLTAAPGSPRPAASARTIVFTAPGGTRLDAGATYLVVLAGSGFVRVESTNSSAQDAGGASGWTIDGVGAGNSSPYSYGTSDSLLMNVNGTTARAQRAVREKVAKDEQQEEEQEPAMSPDPDRGISLSTSSSSAIEGEAVTISVRRAGPTDRATTVTVQVLDSALDGAWPMDLVFRSGAATATAAVAIGFDGARPASRTVTVSLASVKEPYSVGSPSTLTFNVTDRDAALSVADASVSEGPGARLAFAVTLDRTRDRKVLVRYATADGTATQGEDYTGVSGTLRFAPGETTKTVSVPVLDDAHDEGSETLTLTLSSPRRAVIDDGTAVGTIVNSDPLPNAWLSRFGRAASDHVVQSIGRRLEGGESESHLTVMGWRVDTLLQSTHPERDGREPRADAPGRQPEGSVRASEGWTGGATRGGGAMSDPGAARPAFDGAMTQGVPPMQGGALQSSARAVGASDNRWLDMLGRLFMALGPNGGEALATPGLRDMVMGSSFYYGYSPDAGKLRSMNRLTAWGESAATRFSGAEGKLSLDGEVNTAIVGADGEWGRWLAGLALSYSEGEGGYRRGSAKGGAVSSTLAGINPYARYRLDERTSFWATLGYGSGRLILTPDGAESALETDMTNAMAAFGGRGVLSMRAGDTGQFELALRSDAMLTDTASIAVAGLSAGAGATSRIRLILEGSGSLPAFGGVLAPKVEAGLRYDGGDAETGAGLEVGGGLAYGKARLTVQVDGRVLLTHRDRDYEEWGYSLSLVYQPSEDGRGLRYQAGSQWGATQSGVQSLWSLQNAGGLVNGARTADGQRYTAELGYGFGVGRLWYPYVATESGGASSQALRFGLKFNAGSALEAGLEIGRRAHLPGEMENDIQLRWQARW